MANTCIKQIMDALETRLELIKTTNGYNFTVKKVSKARRTPYQSFDIPAINFWNLGWTVETGDDAYASDRRIVPVYFEGYCSKWEDNSNEEADKFSADIVTAINRSASAPTVAATPSRNLGGLVTGVSVEDVRYIIDESNKPYCGALVRVDFTFHADSGNMYTISNP